MFATSMKMTCKFPLHHDDIMTMNPSPKVNYYTCHLSGILARSSLLKEDFLFLVYVQFRFSTLV